MQLHTYPLLKVEDPFGLSDADWAEISKLQRAYSLGGSESLSEALIELLVSDRVRAAGVLRAISPVRETIDDEMIRELEVLAGWCPESEVRHPCSTLGSELRIR
jgi:hypothetical protein